MLHASELECEYTACMQGALLVLRLEGGCRMAAAFVQLAAVVRMPRVTHNLGCPRLCWRCCRGGPGALCH